MFPTVLNITNERITWDSWCSIWCQPDPSPMFTGIGVIHSRPTSDRALWLHQFCPEQRVIVEINNKANQQCHLWSYPKGGHRAGWKFCWSMNLDNTLRCGGLTKRQGWINGWMEYSLPIRRSSDYHIAQKNRCPRAHPRKNPFSSFAVGKSANIALEVSVQVRTADD